jgi:hypothetical protein
MSEPDTTVTCKSNIGRDRLELPTYQDPLHQSTVEKIPDELLTAIIRSCQHSTDAVSLLLVSRE